MATNVDTQWILLVEH